MAKNLYNLTAVTTVNDSDLLHVNQGSVSSDKKVTKQNLLKEVNSSISSINNSLTKSSGTITKGNFGTMLYATCTKVAGIVTFSFWITIPSTEPTVSGEQTIAILPSGFRPSQIISCGVGMTKFPEGAYAYVQANGAVIVSASMINVHPTMLISGSFAV